MIVRHVAHMHLLSPDLVRDKYKVFHAGEAYALSWDLVTHVATDPVPRTLTVGREDQVTSWWLLRHPQALEIVWWHENCWCVEQLRFQC